MGTAGFIKRRAASYNELFYGERFIGVSGCGVRFLLGYINFEDREVMGCL